MTNSHPLARLIESYGKLLALLPDGDRPSDWYELEADYLDQIERWTAEQRKVNDHARSALAGLGVTQEEAIHHQVTPNGVRESGPSSAEGE